MNPKQLPDYMEIVFNDNIEPLSRLPEENVDIILERNFEFHPLKIIHIMIYKGRCYVASTTVKLASKPELRKAKAFIKDMKLDIEVLILEVKMA